MTEAPLSQRWPRPFWPSAIGLPPPAGRGLAAVARARAHRREPGAGLPVRWSATENVALEARPCRAAAARRRS